MSQQGRFGKYGEIKRFDRLRKAGLPVLPIKGPSGFNHEVFFTKHKPREGAIKIRAAKPGERVFIADLSDQVFAVYGPYREIITGWFNASDTVTFVAFIKKMPIAFGMLGFLSEESYQKRVAELLAIAVIPEYQNQDIGRKVLEVIEGKAEAMHIRQLTLHTAEQNQAAQRLFTKNGFVIAAFKERYYPAGQTGLMMVKEMTVRESIGKTGIFKLE